jgi:hypothetical protein
VGDAHVSRREAATGIVAVYRAASLTDPKRRSSVRTPKFVARVADSVFHHLHEMFFDPARFWRVTHYDGKRRNKF